MVEENENEYKPKLIENYQEMDPYDINVNIPEPEPIIYPTITFNTISKNGTYTLDQLTTDQSENFSRDSIINTDVINFYDYKRFYFYNLERYIPLDLKKVESKPEVTVGSNCIFYFQNEIINGKKYLYWHFYQNRGYEYEGLWPFKNVDEYPIYYNIRDDFLIYENSDKLSRYQLFYLNDKNEYEPMIKTSAYISNLDARTNKGENIYFKNSQIM